MSDLKTLLDQIDNLSKQEVKLIASTLKGNAYHSDLFEKHDDIVVNSSGDWITLEANAGGLYIFTVNNSIEVNIKDFNDVNKATQLKHKTGVSTIHFEKGDTLYVGKSEDDLQNRINQHIGLREDSCTYSLKLSSEKRKFLFKNNLSVSYFTIKAEYQKHKKILLPVIERYLHKELSPLVGSAKTS